MTEARETRGRPATQGPKLGATIYSYSYDLRLGTRTVEDCVADIADMGSDGVELLGESHVPEFPAPADEWVDRWFGWMDRYGTRPTAFDGFIDTRLHHDRLLTVDETVGQIVRDLKLAKRLGFGVMRTISPPFPPDNPVDAILAPYAVSTRALQVLEKAVTVAEELDVKIGIEIHSPAKLKSAYMDRVLELIHRTRSRHLGFVPDMSIFVHRPPQNEEQHLLAQGARADMLRVISDLYLQGVGPDRTVAEVSRLGGNEIEQRWAGIAGIHHFSNNEPKLLLDVLPHTFHIHAKFYKIDAELQEHSISYAPIIEILQRAAFAGYFSSEYEGRRTDLETSQQIRLHHIMLRKLWAAATASHAASKTVGAERAEESY